MRMDRQPSEQGLVAGEQLADGVEQQGFAEAAWAGEEILAALVDQLPDKTGLIDVIAAVLAQLREGLDTDGQFAAWFGHRGMPRAG
jgi:hypothetical protein